ncbi:MAG: methyl-accepting chemotaxis protein [Novosphingobium sp.]
MNELDSLRRKGAKTLLGLSWMMVAVIAIGAAFATTGWAPFALALAVTLVPTVQVMRGDFGLNTRMAIGIAVPSYSLLLIWQWTGSPWMIDMHMIFFAGMATLLLLVDWRPLLAGNALAAVHHVIFNFTAPWLVFPDGGDFGRLLLHAAVLIAEATVAHIIASSFEKLLINQEQAQAAREELERQAAADRERIAREQQLVIDGIGSGLRALASGNLSLRLEEAFPQSYEALRQNFNSTAVDLDRIINEVAQSTGTIRNGSREIRIATGDLARRTEEQASSLEEIANALRQLNEMVRNNASDANTLQGNVSRARDNAVEGKSVVENAVRAMSEIEHSATEIGQIIELINGISFQTNLLALNAGVEAARAGESGKGFAVVANEVRALAQRSADAANKIRALIDASSQQINEGVILVGQSGDVLMTIVEGIADIDQAIARIADTSQVQAEGISGIHDSVTKLDTATQQNAAMAEQGTAAACSLSDEAESMAEVVSYFQASPGNSDTKADGNMWAPARAA